MLNCARDEGRPLGAGLQEQALNHLKLHRSRAVVVSVKEKSGPRLGRIARHEPGLFAHWQMGLRPAAGRYEPDESRDSRPDP